MTLGQLPVFEIITGLLSLGGWYLHREFKRVRDDAAREAQAIRHDVIELKEDRIKPLERYMSRIIQNGATKDDIKGLSDTMQTHFANLQARMDRVVDKQDKAP